ncbi:MAG: hypothetical protein FWF56_06150 [Firmicutes bacterium]|nr:hypothetical protein [Bacillota bacterium]MCL1953289.1 hypothetical protein [Bacillota bacterium]
MIIPVVAIGVVALRGTSYDMQTVIQSQEKSIGIGFDIREEMQRALRDMRDTRTQLTEKQQELVNKYNQEYVDRFLELYEINDTNELMEFVFSQLSEYEWDIINEYLPTALQSIGIEFGDSQQRGSVTLDISLEVSNSIFWGAVASVVAKAIVKGALNGLITIITSSFTGVMATIGSILGEIIGAAIGWYIGNLIFDLVEPALRKFFDSLGDSSSYYNYFDWRIFELDEWWNPINGHPNWNITRLLVSLLYSFL